MFTTSLRFRSRRPVLQQKSYAASIKIDRLERHLPKVRHHSKISAGKPGGKCTFGRRRFIAKRFQVAWSVMIVIGIANEFAAQFNIRASPVFVGPKIKREVRTATIDPEVAWTPGDGRLRSVIRSDPPRQQTHQTRVGPGKKTCVLQAIFLRGCNRPFTEYAGLRCRCVRYITESFG